ncbi:MAG: hypothetical protein ACQCXQ_02230, partial [Verrucomicrobiales bacterium]
KLRSESTSLSSTTNSGFGGCGGEAVPSARFPMILAEFSPPTAEDTAKSSMAGNAKDIPFINTPTPFISQNLSSDKIGIPPNENGDQP